LDLVLAVGLVLCTILWKAPRRRVVPLTIALVATTALYLVQFAAAGFGAAFRGMVVDPVFHLRGGRGLPLPPPWGHYDSFLQYAGDSHLLPWPLATLRGPHQLFLWFFALLASVGFLLVVAVRSSRRHRGSPRARALLAVAAFSVGILPQTLQRPDSTHIAWVAWMPMAFLPVAIFELLRDPPGRPARRMRLGSAQLVACLLPVLGFVLVLPNFTVQRYVDFVAQTFGQHRYSYAVERDGRTFYYGNAAVATAGQQAVDLVAKTSRPGERLFVGTGDLRKTPYSDAWLYYLFPELVPGTYYIEMDPGVANAKGSRLARDLRRSDVVILSTVWDDWNEPNGSRTFGSDVPNQVLRKEFCMIGDFGGYFRVYRRCAPGPPAPASS
jgi:hypothetical protein